jgi:hypothetical protein
VIVYKLSPLYALLVVSVVRVVTERAVRRDRSVRPLLSDISLTRDCKSSLAADETALRGVGFCSNGAEVTTAGSCDVGATYELPLRTAAS